VCNISTPLYFFIIDLIHIKFENIYNYICILTMSSTEQIIHDLLLNQMEEFAILIVTHFPNIATDRIIQITQEHCNSIHFGDCTPYISKKYNDKKCMARVWRSGSGNEQCINKCTSGDYCTKHAKQAKETDQPCQVNQDGKKRGLFCGRIDQYQDNRVGIPPYKSRGRDGNYWIRIEWTSDKMKYIVDNDVNEKKSIKGWSSKLGTSNPSGSYPGIIDRKPNNTVLLTPSFFMKI
jgi:hypothetical protein